MNGGGDAVTPSICFHPSAFILHPCPHHPSPCPSPRVQGEGNRGDRGVRELRDGRVSRSTNLMPSSTNRRRRLPHCLVAFCALAASAVPAAAQQHIPQPRLNALFPLGGKAGTEFELTFNGDALEGAQQLVFTHPSIT